MDSTCFGASETLRNLAQQLRLYKPIPTFEEDGIEEERNEESARKVDVHVGVAESTAPITHPERFKPKRAAVLICIFEGDNGDLRVILTKRSSRLSTHSGQWR